MYEHIHNIGKSMPNSKQAKKRMVQSEKKRKYNHSYISKMRTSIKTLLKSIRVML